MARMVSDNRARQGPQGRPVLYVLIASLVLMGLFMVAFLTWSGNTPNTNPSQGASRESVTGTPPPSTSTTSGVPAANPAYPASATPSANPPAPANR